MKNNYALSLALRMVACIYLFYIVFTLWKGRLNVVGTERVITYVAMVVFTLASIVIGALSIKQYLDSKK